MHSKLSLPEVPMLMVEFHGTPEAGVAEQGGALRRDRPRRNSVVGRSNGLPKTEDRTRLWQARHDAYWAGFTLRPGAQTVPTDVCVPISRLAECVAATQADLAESGLVAPIVGHVGDGNFHVQLLVDEADRAEMDRVAGFLDRLVRRALAMEGTCTGEHGVGQGKAEYLREEHPPAALAAMRAIKAALDPLDIMNPGKILPIEA